jgi:ribonuclease-3
MKPVNQLEDKLKYKFKNQEYLINALTHSSYANEHSCESYERLEFLGDSVLGFITAEYLYENHSSLPEGELTKLRASLVCEKTLSSFSRELSLGDYMRLSHGEINSKGNERPSILCDMFESVTAAIYLDSESIETTRKFVLRFISAAAQNAKKKSAFRDYKTKLQEIIQQNPEEKLSYQIVSESGPDHNKHFVVEVHLNSNVIGKGGGKSKKEAEQQAARVALELMGY